MSPSSPRSLPAPSVLPADDRRTDAQWFAAEVQPHERKLRGWLRGRFPSLRDLDDLVQEAYARLFRARAAGKVVNPKTYLFATARNAALDFFRRRQVALTVEIPESQPKLEMLWLDADAEMRRAKSSGVVSHRTVNTCAPISAALTKVASLCPASHSGS